MGDVKRYLIDPQIIEYWSDKPGKFDYLRTPVVLASDFDAALAREAALREELATSNKVGTAIGETLGRVTAERDDLHKRLTAADSELAEIKESLAYRGSLLNRTQQRAEAAEQRNAEMLDILGTINCLGIVRLMDEGLQRRIKTIVHQLQREKIAAALKPTESGAGE